MAQNNFNLLEWYAAHRGEVGVLRDPSALFALGLLDNVGDTTRSDLQQDLGVQSAELDQTIDKLYAAGFLETRGTHLAVTPQGKQFLTEIGLRGPLPPPPGKPETPQSPKPPTVLPERPPAKPPAAAAPGMSCWLWGLIGILIVGTLLVFGVMLNNPGAEPPTRIADVDTPVPPSTAIDQGNNTEGPRIVFQSDPPTLTAGECAILLWRVSEASSVFLDGTSVPLAGRSRMCPEETTEFTLGVISLDGEEHTRVVEVVVNPAPLPPEPKDVTIEFWADPSEIAAGDCTTLYWQVTDAQDVFLDSERVNPESEQQVCPEKSRTYTLTAISQTNDQRTRSVEVTVTPAEANYFWDIVDKDPPFDSPGIRNAMGFAVDEPEISKAVLQGDGVLRNVDPSLDKLGYDPGRAQEMLKEAGYEGQPVFIVPKQDRRSVEIANHIAESLGEVGFDVRIVTVESRATILVGPAQ